MSARRIPYGRNLGFLDQSRYFFFKAAPQLYSRDRVDPVSGPLLLEKPGSAEDRTQTSGSVGRNSDHYTTEAASTYTQDNTNKINALRHPCLACDTNPRQPAFQRAKKVHALNRAATMIDYPINLHGEILWCRRKKTESKAIPVTDHADPQGNA
jgi:hypothetical protein